MLLVSAKTWPLLTIVLIVVLQNAAQANEADVLKDLAKSHPYCKLYGHFYAPKQMAEYGHRPGSTARKSTLNREFARSMQVMLDAGSGVSVHFLYGGHKAVDDFIQGKSNQLRGYDSF